MLKFRGWTSGLSHRVRRVGVAPQRADRQRNRPPRRLPAFAFWRLRSVLTVSCPFVIARRRPGSRKWPGQELDRQGCIWRVPAQSCRPPNRTGPHVPSRIGETQGTCSQNPSTSSSASRASTNSGRFRSFPAKHQRAWVAAWSPTRSWAVAACSRLAAPSQPVRAMVTRTSRRH